MFKTVIAILVLPVVIMVGIDVSYRHGYEEGVNAQVTNYQSSSIPAQNTIKEAQVTLTASVVHTTTTIQWIRDERTVVRELTAFSERNKGRIAGGGLTIFKGDTCVIYAVQPGSWSDWRRMITLAHEVMHCFGFTHQ